MKKIKKTRYSVLLIGLLLFSCTNQKQHVITIPEKTSLDATFESNVSRQRKIEYKADMPVISVSAVGDLMMSSWIIEVVNESGVDFPFDSTRDLLCRADVAIANLEAPLSKTGENVVDKKYTFKVPPHFVAGIKNAGIDVVTLANNHILDFGWEALSNCMSTLDSVDIEHCGAGENVNAACSPTLLNVNGYTIAFLGFSMTYPQEFWAGKNNPGTCYPTEKRLENLIQESEELADLTIVSFHWGAEKHNHPREYQQVYAHRAIDFGADLVLGHHPHVLQGMEVYKNRLIAYSLGNYVFASFSNVAKTSAVLKSVISPDGLLYAKVYPINVHNRTVNFQPRLFTGEHRQKVIDELNSFSLPLNDDKKIIDDEGYILPGRFLQ